MIDKEKLRDLMRNCSEEQYKYLTQHFFSDDIRFNRLNEGYRVAFKYDEEASVTELIFLSEEEEKNYFCYAKRPFGIWSTAELGKYYLYKYDFLHEKVEGNNYYLGAIHSIYNQEGKTVLYWYEG